MKSDDDDDGDEKVNSGSVTIQSQCLFWNTLQIKQNSDKQTKKNYTKILSTKKKGEKKSAKTNKQPNTNDQKDPLISILARSTHFSFI